MSDETLRELERRWRLSGQPADELRWHVARVRAGELDPARLELAAGLGWPGASAEPAPPEWAALRAVATRLVGEPPALDRALVALCEHAWPRLTTGRDAPLRAQLRALGDALAARVLSPALPPEPRRPATTAPAGLLPWITWGALLAQALLKRLSGDPAPEWDSLWPGSPRVARQLLGKDAAESWAPELQAALRAALAPWALGLADPLRERAARALDALEIATPCSARWEDMSGDERVRHCAECRLQVYDLSALPRAEAEALLRRHEGQRLCVRLYRRADGRVLSQDCPEAVAELARPRHRLMGKVAPR